MRPTFSATPSFFRPLTCPAARTIACVVVALVVAMPAVAHPQGASADAVAKKLNTENGKVSAGKQSGPKVFKEWVKLPAAPVGDSTAIWPGIANWDAVSAWAKGGNGLGDALIASQHDEILGLAYGVKGASPEFREKGLFVDLAEGEDFGMVSYPYLKAVDGIGAYATAEMYRAAEAGEWDRAFNVGIAWLRFLRQVSDRQMMAEVQFATASMSQALSIHRDFLWRYREKIPVDVLKRVALKEYPLLRTGDGERLRRLRLPEGDLDMAKAVMERTFRGGQPNAVEFVNVYASQDSSQAPLMRFGQAKTWRKVAELHGAKDASTQKIDSIYDDWYRRWRSRPYGRLSEVPTELSRTNDVRYAAVIFSMKDLQDLFEARKLLIANINGTAVAAGLCAFRNDYQGTWPGKIKEAYAVHVVKRMNLDPFDKRGEALGYRTLSSPRKVQLPNGSLNVDGVMLWAIGSDNKDDDGARHTDDGTSHDLLLWPPVRELSRELGTTP